MYTGKDLLQALERLIWLHTRPPRGFVAERQVSGYRMWGIFFFDIWVHTRPPRGFVAERQVSGYRICSLLEKNK